LHNAIVWNDKRTSSIVKQFEERHNGDLNLYRSVCGLPINTYFSGVKMRWLLDNVESVKSAHDEGNVIFATIDTWLIYVSFIIFIL
jgi:glycerol kinase